METLLQKINYKVENNNQPIEDIIIRCKLKNLCYLYHPGHTLNLVWHNFSELGDLKTSEMILTIFNFVSRPFFVLFVLHLLNCIRIKKSFYFH